MYFPKVLCHYTGYDTVGVKEVTEKRQRLNIFKECVCLIHLPMHRGCRGDRVHVCMSLALFREKKYKNRLIKKQYHIYTGNCIHTAISSKACIMLELRVIHTAI